MKDSYKTMGLKKIYVTWTAIQPSYFGQYLPACHEKKMKKETRGQAPGLRWKNSQPDFLKANVGPNDSSSLDIFLRTAMLGY